MFSGSINFSIDLGLILSIAGIILSIILYYRSRSRRYAAFLLT